MTRLKQLKNYPIGDCQRTVFACLLGYESPLDVPNFTEMEENKELMENNFVRNIYNWLDENNLTYIEVTEESFKHSGYIPLGYCTISGKSPRGDYNHIVIGKITLNKDNLYELRYVWDTSPFHDGNFIDGKILSIGFLSRKI